MIKTLHKETQILFAGELQFGVTEKEELDLFFQIKVMLMQIMLKSGLKLMANLLVHIIMERLKQILLILHTLLYLGFQVEAIQYRL